MLGKRKKLSPHQEELQRQLHKHQHLLKTQKRLETISTYLDNMRAMLQDSVQQLTPEAYPTEGFTWLIDKGLPVLQAKVKNEQRRLYAVLEQGKSHS